MTSSMYPQQQPTSHSMAALHPLPDQGEDYEIYDGAVFNAFQVWPLLYGLSLRYVWSCFTLYTPVFTRYPKNHDPSESWRRNVLMMSSSEHSRMAECVLFMYYLFILGIGNAEIEWLDSAGKSVTDRTGTLDSGKNQPQRCEGIISRWRHTKRRRKAVSEVCLPDILHLLFPTQLS